MRTISLFTALFLASLMLIAQEQTFIKEYTYNASEIDSKVSCRAIAINQLRSLLLNEIGVYVQSESILKTSDVSGKFSQDFVENIATISAGVTKLEVLQETWNGETFWMKASITVDKKNLEESLKQLIQDRQKLKELNETRQQLSEATKEINRLRKELLTKDKKTDSTLMRLNISKYNNEIKSLNAANYIINGRNKLWKEDFVGAIEDFTKAIELDPKSETYKNRGIAKQGLLDYKGSISDFTKAIQINPKDSYLYYSRGNSKYSLKEYEAAIEDFTNAIELNPIDIISYYFRGFSKQDLNDQPGAIEDFTKTIELVESNITSDDFTFIVLKEKFKKSNHLYFSRGISKYLFRDDIGAISDFTKAIEINPNDALSYESRARARGRLKDYERSMKDVSKAIELNPKYGEAYFFRAQLKTVLVDDVGSIADYTKAIELNPKDAASYEGRGRSKFALHDFRGAVEDFSIVISLTTNSGNIYFLRGLSKFFLNQKASSCQDFSKAGELGYAEAYDAIRKYCN